MAQPRRYLPRTDDDVALHPMARRHVVAAVLLCIGLLAFFLPAPRATSSSFESSCEMRDRSGGDAVARLIQDRDEAHINDAVSRLYKTRENCRTGHVRPIVTGSLR